MMRDIETENGFGHSSPDSGPPDLPPVEGTARPLWFWLPVITIGGVLFLAGGIYSIPGDVFPNSTLLNVVGAIVLSILGLFCVVSFPETLAVYRWDAEGLTKTTPFRRKSVRWNDLANATFNGSYYELLRYDLTSRSGTKLSVHLQILPKTCRLREVLLERLKPIRQRKVEEALRRPKTRFTKRYMGMVFLSVVFDGIRLRQGRQSILLAAVTRVRITPIYQNGVRMGERVWLEAPGANSIGFRTEVCNADVLLDLIRDRAPHAVWVNEDQKLPQTLSPDQRREELLHRLKTVTHRIWAIWACIVIIPALMVARHWEWFVRMIHGKIPHPIRALIILGLVLGAFFVLMSFPLRSAYRERARLRHELAAFQWSSTKN